MPKLNDLSNREFGRLTVVKKSHNDGKNTWWLCRCTCNNETIVRGDRLLKGITSSCGCLRKEVASDVQKANFTKHGLSKTRLYRIWVNMIQRCTNPNATEYEYYGGKGVTVCQEWRDSFTSFSDWAIANGYEEHLTIDRRDNDKEYSPENCRWISIQEQQLNRSNNRKRVLR